MTEEEFIEKIKEINVTVPDEIFFLEYNKCVYDILKENQKYIEPNKNEHKIHICNRRSSIRTRKRNNCCITSEDY